MIQSKFKIRDKVKVTDPDWIYLSYDEMAGIMDLKNWQSYKSIKRGSVGTVINIKMHQSDISNIIIGIRLEDETEYIMDEKGLKLIPIKK
jgi:hypothetical protein